MQSMCEWLSLSLVTPCDSVRTVNHCAENEFEAVATSPLLRSPPYNNAELPFVISTPGQSYKKCVILLLVCVSSDVLLLFLC